MRIGFYDFLILILRVAIKIAIPTRAVSRVMGPA